MGVGWLVALLLDCSSRSEHRAQPHHLEKPKNGRTGDRRTLLGQGVTLETGAVSRENYKVRLHSGIFQDKYVIKYFAILELVLSHFVRVAA